MSCNAYENQPGMPTPEAFLDGVCHPFAPRVLPRRSAMFDGALPKPLRSIPFREELKFLLLNVVEHGRIQHWVAAGVYYGYPQHCIEAFLARTTIRITQQGSPEELAYVTTDLPEAQPYESVGCIPSEELLALPLEEGVALINQHRFASHPFTPGMEDEPPCVDLMELAETNLEFRERFIEMVRSIFSNEQVETPRED